MPTSFSNSLSLSPPSLFTSHPIPLSPPLTLSLSPPLSPSLSLRLSPPPSLSVSHSLPISLPLSTSPFLFPSLRLSPLPISLPLSFPRSPSLFLPLFLSLFLASSPFLFHSFSLLLSPPLTPPRLSASHPLPLSPSPPSLPLPSLFPPRKTLFSTRPQTATSGCHGLITSLPDLTPPGPPTVSQLLVPPEN